MPDFFDEVDSIGIVEDHAKAVLKLEDSQAEKLLRRYRSIRGELRDRLDRLPGDTFSAQQLRGVLVQVDAAITAMNESLKSGMSDASFAAAMLGVTDQLKEIKVFDKHFTGAIVPININAQLVAEDTNNFLINRYDASIDAYSEATRSNLVQSLTNESLMETPYSTVVKKLGGFLQAEEWRLHRIARTELHHTYSLGKLNGMTEVQDRYLPDLMKTLIHRIDDRTGEDSKALARQNPIVPLDEPFVQHWKGKTFTFMTPPNRPNDRAILVPYRQAWGD